MVNVKYIQPLDSSWRIQPQACDVRLTQTKVDKLFAQTDWQKW